MFRDGFLSDDVAWLPVELNAFAVLGDFSGCKVAFGDSGSRRFARLATDFRACTVDWTVDSL